MIATWDDADCQEYIVNLVIEDYQYNPDRVINEITYISDRWNASHSLEYTKKGNVDDLFV